MLLDDRGRLPLNLAASGGLTPAYHPPVNSLRPSSIPFRSATGLHGVVVGISAGSRKNEEAQAVMWRLNGAEICRAMAGVELRGSDCDVLHQSDRPARYRRERNESCDGHNRAGTKSTELATQVCQALFWRHHCQQQRLDRDLRFTGPRGTRHSHTADARFFRIHRFWQGSKYRRVQRQQRTTGGRRGTASDHSMVGIALCRFPIPITCLSRQEAFATSGRRSYTRH